MRGDEKQIGNDIAEMQAQIYARAGETKANSWDVGEYRTFDPPAGHPILKGFK